MKNAAIATLEQKIADIDVKLAELGHRVDYIKEKMGNVEIDPENYSDAFDEMLDDCHGDFMGYCASQILKEVDPIAYRCGLNDYADSNVCKSDTEEYQDLEEDLEEIENQIEDLEDQRTEAEDDLDQSRGIQ